MPADLRFSIPPHDQDPDDHPAHHDARDQDCHPASERIVSCPALLRK
jgi:hypothetical protein